MYKKHTCSIDSVIIITLKMELNTWNGNGSTEVLFQN